MEAELSQEQTRVDEVVTEIEHQLVTVEKTLAKAHAETSAVEQNYSENASINTFEIDDASETNAEVQQQRQLVARVVETETILKKQETTLNELHESPYFGRIDIKDAADENESLYIGMASLQDAEQDFLIYDWRAPVSAIYYNGTLGDVTYPTPNGRATAELLNKRQFTIQHGKITNMFDTDETVGDEMLQYALGQQSDEYMANIVATIQKEQNDIIRDTTSDLLVVQGVAGSGKTSAILQRIAFLLFHSREELSSDQIILFSPNRLFSHYISEVLPSLGERNMRQVTLAEFLKARLEGLNVQTLFNRYEAEQNAPANQKLRAEMESADFMQVIAKYTEQIADKALRFADIEYNGAVFFSAYHIKVVYSRQAKEAKIAERMLRTKNELINELKRKIIHEAQQPWVSAAINELDDEHYRDLLGLENVEKFESSDDEMEYVSEKFVRIRFKKIYDAIYNNHFFDVYSQYADFLTAYGEQTAEPAIWVEKRERFLAELEYHRIDLVDAIPLMYLRDLVTGSGQNRRMQHVFIDEMQDYSIAQMLYFKHAFPRARYTILGDSEQALFRSIESPAALLTRLKDAFQVKHANLITLNKSYRSTKQITEFGKAFLPDGDQIQAFTRDGDLPIVVESDAKQGLTYLRAKLNGLRANYGTVAILTKNAGQAEKLQQQLRREFGSTLLTATDRLVPNDIVILPIYLAKGLEFDCVIAYGVNRDNYPDADSLGIIYTIASRAMHELTLITAGVPSPLLATVAPDLYQPEVIVNN
ncbi:ATP-dependent DNA helicase [Periweissella cryptocerci]|uniref:ATP-dependent DNA helicase n=1 Tax=Periweissella cryptocerci TaxID=2506420 RepID=A0A4P6YUA5_9LACO|nr:RNA polymerase recycling motor HelD [Periweissella cryptocerci]QBO36312.1 ATP-dependent DNA helicase [Periweissella cryptocerci]